MEEFLYSKEESLHDNLYAVLHQAIVVSREFKQNQEIINYLEEKANYNNETLLHKAFYSPHSFAIFNEILAFLHDNGIDGFTYLNKVNTNGDSPLHYAVYLYLWGQGDSEKCANYLGCFLDNMPARQAQALLAQANRLNQSPLDLLFDENYLNINQDYFTLLTKINTFIAGKNEFITLLVQNSLLYRICDQENPAENLYHFFMFSLHFETFTSFINYKGISSIFF
jgi:ankyrin repeat protein